MPEESVASAGTAPVRRKRNTRKARAAIDKRFVIGKRYKALLATFHARLGPEAVADPVIAAAAEKAARLCALSEDAAAKALRGHPGADMDLVVRLARVSDIALRRLGPISMRPASLRARRSAICCGPICSSSGASSHDGCRAPRS
jgi:hypothetical protein